jgi:hypothetical protein
MADDIISKEKLSPEEQKKAGRDFKVGTRKAKQAQNKKNQKVDSTIESKDPSENIDEETPAFDENRSSSKPAETNRPPRTANRTNPTNNNDNFSKDFRENVGNDEDLRAKRLTEQEYKKAGAINEGSNNEETSSGNETSEDKPKTKDEIEGLNNKEQIAKRELQAMRRNYLLKRMIHGGKYTGKLKAKKEEITNIKKKKKEKELKKKLERRLILRILSFLTPCCCLVLQLTFIAVIVMFILRMFQSI